MLQLEHFSVEGLLGRFNHEITFPAEWEFVILHGPNGIGKTRLLELLDALGNRRLYQVIDMPFDQAEFNFADGSGLVVARLSRQTLPGVDPSDEDEPFLAITLRTSGEEFQLRLLRSELGMSPQQLRQIERELPVQRVGPMTWLDQHFGDYPDLETLRSRYGYATAIETPEIPSPLGEFLDQFPVHLIETQRLIRLPAATSPGPRPRPVQQSTVLRYADDLTTRLREALAENSQTSQQLDRSFPRRVLDRPAPPEATEDEIRARYARQTALRAQLAEIAVLDAAVGDLPLPDRSLDTWERRMLWIYLEDAEEKLATFRYLLARVELLKRIVNSRFLFNELVIDRERGFKFETNSGEEIGADALSSGEQHELVLVYDLLFNVRPETTVLIDEPELSLHVTWQQQFLNDIEEISELASLRFVVATHSPQIIHKWWARTVALYEEELGTPQ